MDLRAIDRLILGRSELIDELAGCLTISEARRDGEPQYRPAASEARSRERGRR
jgi:hypothetical protein